MASDSDGRNGGGARRWIEVRGATSKDVCACVEGRHLWQGQCELCLEGATCLGPTNLALKPGFFAFPEDPGNVFRCFGNSQRCPGGLPGSCAAGRDNRSLACAQCLPGFQPQEDGQCRECAATDFAIVVGLFLLGVLVVGCLHASPIAEAGHGRQHGSLLNAAFGFSQLVTLAQVFGIMRRLRIPWEACWGLLRVREARWLILIAHAVNATVVVSSRNPIIQKLRGAASNRIPLSVQEPFLLLLRASEYLSLDALVYSFSPIQCILPASAVEEYLMAALLLPLAFVISLLLVHFVYICWKRTGLRLDLLGKTVGSFSMLFLISILSSILEPFYCYSHPNGSRTMQSRNDVLCNFRGEHLEICMVAFVICQVPIAFFATCVRILFVDLPKRIQKADVYFVNACSFLTL